MTAKTNLTSERFMKKVALIMKTILRGQLRRVIIKAILVSILLLLAQVRIISINNRYVVKIKAEDIQSLACKNRIQPIVVVEETRIIPFAVVIVNKCKTEYIVPNANKDKVLGFINWINISPAGNF